jgi:hypothetical protein
LLRETHRLPRSVHHARSGSASFQVAVSRTTVGVHPHRLRGFGIQTKSELIRWFCL